MFLGPVGLPFFGYYLHLDHEDPNKTYHDLWQKYGSVISFKLGSRQAYLISGYEAVKEAFLTDELTGRPEICFNRDRFGGRNQGEFILIQFTFFIL